MSNCHQPVLLEEVIQYLAINPEGIYVDATFGRGGHSLEIMNRLNEKGFLLAIDKDPSAVAYAREKFAGVKNFTIKQGSFEMLESFACELNITHKINGILLDLGVSSPQLDDASRGFSFLKEGPLDMRMDPDASMDAATWINAATEEQIVRVLFEYGQERYARRIAKAIVQERKKSPITSTLQLATLVSKAHPSWEAHKHPATRTFQAIRIYINQELSALRICLEQALHVLAIGGRLAVISFHSLEDHIVKRFILKEQRGGDFPPDLPVTQDKFFPRLKRIAWGVKASAHEIKNNIRSRSAILRVAEKIQ